MIVSLDLRTCRINPRQLEQSGKSKMRLHEPKTGDALGRTTWQSSLLGDSGAEFFPEKQRQARKVETGNNEQLNYCPESEFEWPVLNRPQMAGFGVTTEARGEYLSFAIIQGSWRNTVVDLSIILKLICQPRIKRDKSNVSPRGVVPRFPARVFLGLFQEEKPRSHRTLLCGAFIAMVQATDSRMRNNATPSSPVWAAGFDA
jgi:hypothetical protein